jgi:hypothetical protein
VAELIGRQEHGHGTFRQDSGKNSGKSHTLPHDGPVIA